MLQFQVKSSIKRNGRHGVSAPYRPDHKPTCTRGATMAVEANIAIPYSISSADNLHPFGGQV